MEAAGAASLPVGAAAHDRRRKAAVAVGASGAARVGQTAPVVEAGGVVPLSWAVGTRISAQPQVAERVGEGLNVHARRLVAAEAAAVVGVTPLRPFRHGVLPPSVR